MIIHFIKDPDISDHIVHLDITIRIMLNDVLCKAIVIYHQWECMEYFSV